jgi:hypothetical protein
MQALIKRDLLHQINFLGVKPQSPECFLVVYKLLYIIYGLQMKKAANVSRIHQDNLDPAFSIAVLVVVSFFLALLLSLFYF